MRTLEEQIEAEFQKLRDSLDDTLEEPLDIKTSLMRDFVDANKLSVDSYRDTEPGLSGNLKND